MGTECAAYALAAYALLLLLLLLPLPLLPPCSCIRSCQSYKANNPEVHVSVTFLYAGAWGCLQITCGAAVGYPKEAFAFA